MIYTWIGRAVVGFVRWRWGRELRIAGAAAVAVTVLGLGAYLASRDDEEE